MSRWTPRPADGEPDGLILFDGVCVFCSRWVRFLIARDTARRFSFLPIQSDRGRALGVRHGVDPDAPQTNAVILDGRIWFKSDAALQVLVRLPGWGLARLLCFIPRVLRDPIYDGIARNRYRLFGRSETCMAPSPEDRARFLS